MSIKLASHVFGIALAMLPIGLLVTILTHNGGGSPVQSSLPLRQ